MLIVRSYDRDCTRAEINLRALHLGLHREKAESPELFNLRGRSL